MATNHLSEEQLVCSVCLNVFTDPVTIPCGHNFCLVCLKGLWDQSDQYKCKACDKAFVSKPEISVNKAFKEISERFKAVQNCAGKQLAKPGEIACDVCTGEIKFKALKSCLVCLTSYCEVHLEPHQRVTNLKKHKLIDPVDHLEDRMCKKHQRLLEFFCVWDQMCVCQFCTETDHLEHETVTLKEECDQKKTQLTQVKANVQQMVQERLEKTQEIKRSVELSKANSQREIEDGAQILRALVSSIEEREAELVREIEEKQKAVERKAEGLIKDLGEEITELRTREADVEQISHTEDYVFLLQRFPVLSSCPQTEDWSEVSIYPDQCVGSVRRAVSKVEDAVRTEMVRLTENELERVQQYTVDVVLDPDTAHPNILLSEDSKQAGRADTQRQVPDNPERFDPVLCVLGKKGFSSGRFYYEVQVKDKTFWDSGVVRESVNRKGQITSTPDNGYWTMRLRNGEEYRALGSPSVRLCLQKKPEKVGVFVDYEAGLVSFYDVEDRFHIYSFVGNTFTEKLYPFFSPGVADSGKNMSPLILTPVRQTK
ncbi:E3 ubiquitin-protein ligase TRIM39-like [Chanos chanos]|uniref:E3 ubiquitin-protein ligase TRIM39-like n=1 Tax=Chanos chanos TaxID=29144 RepID=A0A6J2VRJ6_CHACN|nr:E3 ubiquitin-protein ligase TRIM39-like [Chanos chanos]